MQNVHVLKLFNKMQLFLKFNFNKIKLQVKLDINNVELHLKIYTKLNFEDIEFYTKYTIITYILKLDAIAYTINKFCSYGPPCYGKDNATKGNPSFIFVPSKVLYDVLWNKSFKYGWIKLEKIVDTNASNGYKPNANYRSKSITHFVSSKSLNHEQHDQDNY